MKLLSIAIPCFNSENYMRKCIESLLVGGDDVEIIIVDDGSTRDRTAEIADEYAAKYPAIVKVVHKANGGLGTINSVVLTVDYMNARCLPLKGIIFNRFEPGNILHEDNLIMCEALTGLKVLACVKAGDTDLELSMEQLEALYEAAEVKDDLVSI